MRFVAPRMDTKSPGRSVNPWGMSQLRQVLPHWPRWLMSTPMVAISEEMFARMWAFCLAKSGLAGSLFNWGRVVFMKHDIILDFQTHGLAVVVHTGI